MTDKLTSEERRRSALRDWKTLAEDAGYRHYPSVYTDKFQRGGDTVTLKLSMDGKVLDATVNGHRPERIAGSLSYALRRYFHAEADAREAGR